MTTDLALTQLILKTEHYYGVAENFFNQRFPRPHIKADLTGHSAGIANLQKNLLRFNLSLFIPNQISFLNQTVPHEVAHLVVYQRYGLSIKPHGNEWKFIMSEAFHCPAQRCHQYPIPAKKKNYYLYQCHCAQINHSLSSRRHTFIKKGYRYICRTCKQPLTFTGKTVYQ